MPSLYEKRSHERQNVRIPIHYDIGESGDRHTGEIINLSKNGAYLLAPSSQEIGNRLTFHIKSIPFKEKSQESSMNNNHEAVVKTCHILPKSGGYSYGIGVMLQESLPDKEWTELFPPADPSGRSIGRSSSCGTYTLRQRAEDFLSRTSQTIFKLKPESIQQLVSELYLHQVELQMQGEELRKAHDEIEVALAQYADLYDFAPVGYFTIDKAGVIEKANMTGAAMLGVERSRLIKIPFTHYILREDRDIFWQHRLAVMDTNSRQACEIRLKSKSDDTAYVQLQSQYAIESDQEGAEPKIFMAIIDITERKFLENRLAEAQKLEAIGTLAGGVAHDFNNLMMAIQGSVSVMRFDLGENHTQAEHLGTIEAEINRASKLTHQLLAFARGGRYEVHATDINTIIQASVDFFSRTRKDIEIVTELQEHLASVAADTTQLEQVFLNLFINAADAMPDGGRLEVGTNGITFENSQHLPHNLPAGEYINITVTDTGIGMDEATRKRVFEPFFTTKVMGRGTGLGLASSYGIIRNHHGWMEVFSRPEQGTTFTICLPVTDRKAVVRTQKASPKELRKGTETILVVDDELKIRKMVASMLEHLGYKTIQADSGKQAIAHYNQNQGRIDLVLLDMTMPGMDGRETFDGLKQLDPNVCVLLASGYSRQGKAEDIINRGCRGFIQKPYTLIELSQTIRSIFDQS